MRRSTLTERDFVEPHLLVGFEGGAVYTAEREDKFYIIQDESTMAGLLSEEDLEGMRDDLVKVLEFDTLPEREAYIGERGWRENQRRRRS
jgi:hypothetical protein